MKFYTLNNKIPPSQNRLSFPYNFLCVTTTVSAFLSLFCIPTYILTAKMPRNILVFSLLSIITIEKYICVLLQLQIYIPKASSMRLYTLHCSICRLARNFLIFKLSQFYIFLLINLFIFAREIAKMEIYLILQHN